MYVTSTNNRSSVQYTINEEPQIMDRDILREPEAVIKFIQGKLKDSKNEVFFIIYLNVKNEVIRWEWHAEGTVDQAVIYPRRIAQRALLSGAAGILLAHNHPSGHCYPSQEDRKLTKVIKDSLKILDVKVLDHIIVSATDYYSFQEVGDL